MATGHRGNRSSQLAEEIFNEIDGIRPGQTIVLQDSWKIAKDLYQGDTLQNEELGMGKSMVKTARCARGPGSIVQRVVQKTEA
jgi:hypothetical protein